VSVLQAQQDVSSAQQDLAAATLRAPVSGTVGAVGISAGQRVGTSQGIVVAGSGAALVTFDVPLAQVGLLRVGQVAQTVPAGTTTSADGVIQSVGVMPSSTASTSPTYPVTVAVDRAPLALATGSRASVAVTTGTARGVVTVPVSAVSGVVGGRGRVTILGDGRQTTSTVGIGAVGHGLAEVTSGLSSGAVVVPADPSQPLPTADLPGRFGGGGPVTRVQRQ
jgi:multidrug efflux pump subunit AcrA (membrane-fusion protein)